MKIQRTLLFSALAAGCAIVRGPDVVLRSNPVASKFRRFPTLRRPLPQAMTVPNGPYVVMDTSMGRITCQFFQKQAPIAVANFIGLAEGTKDWTDPARKATTTSATTTAPFFIA